MTGLHRLRWLFVVDSVGADSADQGTASKSVIRRLAVLVLAVAWAVAVLVWPRLPVGSDPAALGRVSAVLIAAASIDGGLVVLTLTVGLIALQILSQFSWRLNRTIIDGSLIALISAAVAGGVVWPLRVAAGPSPVWARWAFTSFGWSVLLIASAAWLAAERIQPAWLVTRVCRRALHLVDRSRSDLTQRQCGRAARTVLLRGGVRDPCGRSSTGWLPAHRHPRC
jgi:hypothetical protein